MSAEREAVERFVRGITLNGLTFEGEAVMDSLLNALCASERDAGRREGVERGMKVAHGITLTTVARAITIMQGFAIAPLSASHGKRIKAYLRAARKTGFPYTEQVEECLSRLAGGSAT